MKKFLTLLTAIPNCVTIIVTFGNYQIVVKDSLGDKQAPSVSFERVLD